MNCQQCQQKILDSLASGASHVTPEVAAHQNSCPACAQFFATQQNLFHAIDAGLQSFVNQPVPPSLLPTVRARLDENSEARRSVFVSLGLASIAALAILAFAVPYALYRPHNAVNSEKLASTSRQQAAAPQVVGDATTIQAHPEAVRVLPVSNHGRNATKVPEVIVPAEERQAFAKFLAEAPQRPQVALAFTHPATGVSGALNETALLRIDPVEVKSLDGTDNE